MLSCIENNEQTREYETFVILDNGNFYAKNAWIEGSVRATSGNILGTLILGEDPSQEEQEFIKIDGINGVISGGILTSDTSDYFSFWEINSDGSAKFTNAYVSGVLGSAVFGKNTI
jgi:hypothetical protein